MDAEVIWHLTLCTLLSSQRSDAPNKPTRRLFIRATSLTYTTFSRASHVWHRGAQVGENNSGGGFSILDHYAQLNKFNVVTDWDWPPLEAGSSAAFPNLWGDER